MPTGTLLSHADLHESKEMQGVTAAKAALRVAAKTRLASMAPACKKTQSEFVAQKLLRHPVYKKSARVAVYLSMDNEVNTVPILEDIFRSGKACFIPRYASGRDMAMVRLESMADLHSLPRTKWNIRQPGQDDVREDALSSGGLDLVLVPGVAFSANGDRLGHGKGYYDAFLHRCAAVHAAAQTEPPATIALAFREQLVDLVPTEPHDVRLQLVLYKP